MNAAPIFVHSLFRSGSTYLFEVFRRSPAGYWCYQEPLNEHLRHAADAPDRLLEISSRDSSLLRHPTLDKPYFWEFYQVRGAIAPLFRKELSYDGFFATPDSSSFRNLVSYLRGLIDSAQGRPFFQCCRTTGRSGALREALAGTHIHLWRNPHDQWWSYQVGDYFNATTQRIFNAADLPPPLVAVKAMTTSKKNWRTTEITGSRPVKTTSRSTHCGSIRCSCANARRICRSISTP
jgi:hypothetical protein